MFCHLLPPLLPFSDESSIRYLNFTASEMTSKVIQHQYQVRSRASLGPERMLRRELDVKRRQKVIVGSMNTEFPVCQVQCQVCSTSLPYMCIHTLTHIHAHIHIHTNTHTCAYTQIHTKSISHKYTHQLGYPQCTADTGTILPPTYPKLHIHSDPLPHPGQISRPTKTCPNATACKPPRESTITKGTEGPQYPETQEAHPNQNQHCLPPKRLALTQVRVLPASKETCSIQRYPGQLTSEISRWQEASTRL